MARLRLLVVSFVIVVLATACGGGQVPSSVSGAATMVPVATSVAAGAVGDLVVDRSRLAKELHFYNWTDYIAPEILQDFEREFGVKVIVDLYDSNEDMIAKIRPGNSGYDLVAPSDYAVDIMAREKLIAPLDRSLIPNFKHLKPQNLDLYYDKGNVFSVPYFFGLTGIAYNKTKFSSPPDSWKVLFDPALYGAFKGEFSMLNDERETPGAVLKYLGKSLNDTDPALLEQVKRVLIEQKALLAAYNSSDVNRKLASGEYVIAHAWSGQALQARLGLGDDFSGNQDIGFVIPKEGGTIWQDNLAVVAGTPNSYTAHVFINYLLRPDVAAKNTQYVLYLSPNADAEPLLSPELQALYREGFAPSDETYKRLEWIVRNEKTTVFTDIWTAVLGR